MSLNETGVCPKGDFRPSRCRNSESGYIAKITSISHQQEVVYACSIGAKFEDLK